MTRGSTNIKTGSLFCVSNIARLYFFHKFAKKKNKIFNRQLTSLPKHVMCCERTVVGLKLPEDGVNKQNTCRKRDKNVSDKTQSGTRQVVNKIYFISSSQLFNFSPRRSTNCGFCKITFFENILYKSQNFRYI
jgi:hypothetical protein